MATPKRFSEEELRKMEARKKRKLEKKNAIKTGDWDRCMFQIPSKKNRYCNVRRINDSLYCGNHKPCEDNGSISFVESNSSKRHAPELRKRIPCPLDNSHTVYAYDMKKHLAICNFQKKKMKMNALPYYCKNINSGSVDVVPNDVEKEENLLWKLSKIDHVAFFDKIRMKHKDFVGESICSSVLNHNACDEMISEKEKEGAGRSALRHVMQQGSILGNAEKAGLLKKENLFIELGAGKGMLSLALSKALPSCDIVLIDRASQRGKADSNISTDGKCTRVQLDLRDFDMKAMKELENRKLVCISKHLCGVATDLSLRALANTLDCNRSDEMSASLEGMAIALCCHHSCIWGDYINQDYFIKTLGFSNLEFDLMSKMSTWATCSMSADGETAEKVLQCSNSERALLGRYCKRLLDVGRLNFLQKKNMDAKLIYYCSLDDSLENCLLVARKKNVK